MKLSLENYHIFIAGGLGEFGCAISNDLISKGADITILYNSDKNLNNASKYNDLLHFPVIKVNYDDQNDIYQKLKKHSNKYKSNCLISTVGSGKVLNEFPHTKEETKRIWNINYFYNRNLAICITELLREEVFFNKNNLASHVFTSSIASQVDVNAPVEYSISKSALEILTKKLSKHIAPNQRINIVSPGHIFTETGTWGIQSLKNPNKVKSIIENEIPLKRLGETNDIVSIYSMLISQSSSYITGSNIIIDGGISSSK